MAARLKAAGSSTYCSGIEQAKGCLTEQSRATLALLEEPEQKNIMEVGKGRGIRQRAPLQAASGS